MNLPNKLTLLRIILIPVFMVVLYWGFPGATWVALAIFIIASLTDMLDGKIARKYNLVTDFGKFADPLADKMLVTAAMLWFVEIGQMPAWMLLIVICREFAVSGLRMIASDKGRVIAAGWSGKVKTAATMVCVVLPGPGTGQGLQQIAGGQLDGGGGDHAAQEHQHRLHPAEPRWLPLSHQAGEGQQEHQGADAVHRAVGPQQHTPVGESPAVDHHFQKHLIQPPQHGVEKEIEHVGLNSFHPLGFGERTHGTPPPFVSTILSCQAAGSKGRMKSGAASGPVRGQASPGSWSREAKV